jgi:hypothetical protein
MTQSMYHVEAQCGGPLRWRCDPRSPGTSGGRLPLGSGIGAGFSWCYQYVVMYSTVPYCPCVYVTK